MRFEEWLRAGTQDTALLLGGGDETLLDLIFACEDVRPLLLCSAAFASRAVAIAGERFANPPRARAVRRLPEDLRRAGREQTSQPIVAPASALLEHIDRQSTSWRRIAAVIAGYESPIAPFWQAASREVAEALVDCSRVAERPLAAHTTVGMLKISASDAVRVFILEEDGAGWEEAPSGSAGGWRARALLTGAAAHADEAEAALPASRALAPPEAPNLDHVRDHARVLADTPSQDLNALLRQLPVAVTPELYRCWRDEIAALPGTSPLEKARRTRAIERLSDLIEARA